MQKVYFYFVGAVLFSVYIMTVSQIKKTLKNTEKGLITTCPIVDKF